MPTIEELDAMTMMVKLAPSFHTIAAFENRVKVVDLTLAARRNDILTEISSDLDAIRSRLPS